jgi:hypothetical protein
MKTIDFDMLADAGKRAREQLFLKGKRAAGVRVKPRGHSDVEMLALRARERMRKYPPVWKDGVLVLPYFACE